jgi:5-methyltetrahydrofolate corrinoid/iron sulfur protein methyltransferase
LGFDATVLFQRRNICKESKRMIIVADNLQITRTDVAAAVAAFDPAPVRALARRCAAAGAEAVDINSGPLTRRPRERMQLLVEAVTECVHLPIIIDSANPKALEAGLETAADMGTAASRVTINGFSLEPAKLDGVLPLAGRYDADIVGYLLTPDGHVPAGADERMAVAVDLFTAYTRAGNDPARLIIDPVIVPVTWQEGHRQAGEVLEVIRQLPQLLGMPVRTIAGLSNLTTGIRDRTRRSMLARAYLPMLAAAGLDMILMNVLDEKSVRSARASRMLLSDGIFSWNTM